MKKLLCALLALSLTFCTAALASEYDENDRQATTTLITTIEGSQAPTYTIVIPPTLEIVPNAASTQLDIRVTAAENVNSIKVATDASGSMKNDDDGQIDFTVELNTLSFSSFDALPSAKWMLIKIAEEEWQQAPAGTYTGTLSFTISVE